jgi:hypothetical protein
MPWAKKDGLSPTGAVTFVDALAMMESKDNGSDCTMSWPDLIYRRCGNPGHSKLDHATINCPSGGKASKWAT